MHLPYNSKSQIPLFMKSQCEKVKFHRSKEIALVNERTQIKLLKVDFPLQNFFYKHYRLNTRPQDGIINDVDFFN